MTKMHVGATLVVALVVAGALGAAGCARRPSQQGGGSAAPEQRSSVRLSSEQVADRASPATVLILADTTIEIQAPELSIHQGALTAALGGRVTAGASPEDIYRATFDVILNDPSRFFVRGQNVRSKKPTISGLGSGAIITPDGYVATNAHVVSSGEEEIREMLLASMRDWIEGDVQGIEDDLSRTLRGSRMTDEAKKRLIESLGDFYVKSATVSRPVVEVSVVTGYKGSPDAPDIIRVKGTIEKIGEPIPGKDVAIVKIDGRNLPTVRLTPSLEVSEIRQGSDVTVVGYPGRASQNEGFSMPSRLVPSQTFGKVTNFRGMGKPGDQWRVIETDATINHGNSGGPAFDNHGDVVGLATFLLKGQEGIGYIVSIDVVHDFLKELNVKPSTSDFTKQFEDALADYDAGRRPQALDKFRRLRAENPAVRALDSIIDRLDRGQRGSQPGENVTAVARTPTASTPEPSSQRGFRRPMVVFGFLVGLVAVVLAVVIVANRN